MVGRIHLVVNKTRYELVRSTPWCSYLGSLWQAGYLRRKPNRGSLILTAPSTQDSWRLAYSVARKTNTFMKGCVDLVAATRAMALKL